jgi:cobalamin biosynthesis protein CbiG
LSPLALGVGVSSKATGDEVRGLVDEVLRQAGVRLDAIALLATRMRFVDDDRVRIGPPVVGVEDAVLLERFPESGRVGLAARVAEGCALIGAGRGAELLIPTTRSAHVTLALALGSPEPGGP